MHVPTKTKALPPHPKGRLGRRYLRGQAFIEYIVVLAFSVILLTRPIASSSNDPYSPIPAGSSQSALTLLASAIQSYYGHYTYAMSIAYIPECNYSTVVGDTKAYADMQSTIAQSTSSIPSFATSALDTVASNITVSGDRCPDLQNLNLNSLVPSISFGNLPIPTSADDVANLITGQFTNYLHSFTDPSKIVDALNPFGSL
jgi:hypothetical protein